MNYLGIDMYAHNRATRHYGAATTADLIPVVAIDCPFCGKPTTMTEGRIAEHAERCGFTRCPGTGIQPANVDGGRQSKRHTRRPV